MRHVFRRETSQVPNRRFPVFLSSKDAEDVVLYPEDSNTESEITRFVRGFFEQFYVTGNRIQGPKD